MLSRQTQLLLNILDLIGSFAFCLSGALAAVKAEMDYFGIFVLACVTTFGGGVLRDLLLNVPPVALFKTPTYLLICVGCTILVMLVAHHHIEYYTPMLLTFDALGLAAFATIGTLEGIKANTPWYTCIILATITGCGGGIMRDVLRGEKPLVLYGDFYAGLAMLGSLVIIISSVWGQTSLNISVILSCSLIFLARMTVLYFKYQQTKQNNS